MNEQFTLPPKPSKSIEEAYLTGGGDPKYLKYYLQAHGVKQPLINNVNPNPVPNPPRQLSPAGGMNGVRGEAPQAEQLIKSYLSQGGDIESLKSYLGTL